ncbi:hypothetical protein [Haladaptatus halobius]|uniref:hypothetical protein n=1 Tax=Haladaptatus halobius TaxID=2884875 RepID=UPI001D0B120F|nr:hypothetical protein [Haladaptatus halobius]
MEGEHDPHDQHRVRDRSTRHRLLDTLRTAVYALTALLGLSLLIIGTIAIIAEAKGTWHWTIHLESTLSYVGLFVQYLLAVLLPLFGLFVVARRRWGDA